MQQAHYSERYSSSYAQARYHFAHSWLRSKAACLASGLGAAQHHPAYFEHSAPSCAQTKHSFVHLRTRSIASRLAVGASNTRLFPTSGFTLVELIVTIAVLAIIAVTAAPSFATMYSRQKLESSARELAMKIAEARSQAVLLRQSTGVCLASLSEDDCATAIAIPKVETQRIFIARLDSGVTSANTSSTNLSFRRNGSLAAQKNFILQRQNLSYCIQVGVIGDTTIKEGACT
ncbi:hypothetical protein F966_01513 [Acinetobacter higginsii]|uniref:Type II secretion system protein H n=1 Tax=Acinetobacter higginsii TaxID=70347 RepID=N8XMS0_9GAMM|nr:GspH/FimT family pseudopilin [Acinetobacter higginsii]ENV10334.1 hypothetical protein F966_01513 [Acinetobacter higginsii]